MMAKMGINGLIFFIGCIVFFGCAAQQQQVKSDVDNRPCKKNYAEEGGFWVGTMYKSYQDFPKITKTRAYERILPVIASEGWSLTNTNKEMGIISASQMVSYGQGKSCPLNIIIKNRASGGIRVEAFLKTSGGVICTECQDLFCTIFAAVSK